MQSIVPLVTLPVATVKSGVYRFKSVTSVRAHAASSSLTHRAFPASQAAWRGVVPSAHAVFTSAARAKRSRTQAAEPREHAAWRGERAAWGVHKFTEAPPARSSSRHSTFAYSHAAQAGVPRLALAMSGLAWASSSSFTQSSRPLPTAAHSEVRPSLAAWLISAPAERSAFAQSSIPASHAAYSGEMPEFAASCTFAAWSISVSTQPR
mmetsp:Transcript_16025/g.26638  ORF Transcript_16025/g.26638 Transcript_16025/m.26638 type:complete len:208 (+) Transcript_16025:3511-4134(+)